MNYLKQLYRFLNPKFQNVFLDYRVHNHPRYGHGKPLHPRLNKIISSGAKQYQQLIIQVLDKKEQLWTLEERISSPLAFTWRNNFFPGLDTAVLYTILSQSNPNIYLEIGSGISTIIARQAIKDFGLETEIISIDPEPRKEISAIVDLEIKTPLEDVNLEIPERLESGDILFIDNSHRILPNSDSNVFFLDILPNLKSGVIVHLHDIYLPADYPQFMCDRFYSEQYGLAIALLSNPDRYTVLAPNYFISEDPVLSDSLAPLWSDERLAGVERHGGSFWFKIND